MQHNFLIYVSIKQESFDQQVILVQTTYKNIFIHDRFTSEGTNKKSW